MAIKTKIEWADATWNPWIGCTRVSSECENCYALDAMRRYGHDPGVVNRTKTWGLPLRWSKQVSRGQRRERVFTCSWSDWFHPGADEWRDEAWEVVRGCRNLDFLILTKRPERIIDCLPDDWGLGWPNVWLGVTAGTQGAVDKRLPWLLRRQPAVVWFLSVEPMLEDIDICACRRDMQSLDWVIVGCESGPKRRPCRLDWVSRVVEDCRRNDIPCFVKQLSIDGRVTHNPADWPEWARVRQFPVMQVQK